MKKIGAFVSITLACVVFLSGIFLALLQTKSGKEKLKTLVINYARDQGVDLSLGAIEGNLPFKWKIQDITVIWKDENFTIDQAKIRVNFFALLRGRILIDRLTLEHMNFAGAKLTENFRVDASGLILTEIISVKKLVIKNQFLELHAKGSIHQAQCHFSLANLEILDAHLQGKIQGEVALHEHSLEAKIQSHNLKIADQPLQATVFFNAAQEDEKWNGKLRVEGNDSLFPISGESAFQFDPSSALHFSELLFKSKDAELGGELSFNLENKTWEGSLFAYALHLSVFKQFFPGSKLEGSLTAAARVFSTHQQQKLNLHSLLKNVCFFEQCASELSVDAKFDDLFTNPTLALDVDGEKITISKVLFSTLSLQALGEREKGSFELSGSGIWENDFEIFTTGTWEGKTLNFQELKGFMQKNAFAIESPFTLMRSTEKFCLQNFRLHAGEGTCASEILLTSTEAKIHLEGTHFPLGLLPFSRLCLSGSTSFLIDFEGSLDKLEGKGHCVLEEAFVAQEGQKEPFRAKGTILAHLTPKLLQTYASFEAQNGQLIECTATLPIYHEFSPFAIHLDKDAPVSGELAFEGRLEEIFDFINFGSHRVSGLVSSHLFLSKSLRSPQLLGSIELQNGSYENYFTGTQIQKLQAKAEAHGNILEIVFAEGQDMEKGRFSGHGVMDLLPEKKFPFFFDAELTNFHVVRFDSVSGKLTGPARFVGNREEVVAKGRLFATQADLKIPDELPLDLPILPLTFINEPGHFSTTKLPPVFAFKLDVDIDFPHKVFLKGKGLDSEWKGSLHLSGTNVNVKAAGTLTLVKGEYLFGGKVFKLTQGEILFSDQENLASYLNLSGRLQLQNLTIMAHLKGPLLSPTFTFESIPPLPPSSIFSFILFNKDISEISPFQALQVAQTVISMSGGAGPNVLESIRKSLGVDRLSLVSSPDSPDVLSIQVGKYLTRNVLVSLVQGATSSQVQVEVDLKNGFVLLAETQEEEEGKFTLRWNKNY
jgi:translocation and assembly module TamB